MVEIRDFAFFESRVIVSYTPNHMRAIINDLYWFYMRRGFPDVVAPNIARALLQENSKREAIALLHLCFGTGAQHYDCIRRQIERYAYVASKG